MVKLDLKFIFLSLAVHRYQKSCIYQVFFDARGSGMKVIINKNFIAQKVKIWRFCAKPMLYTSKKSLEHVQYKFKEKKYDFFQKKKIFNIFNFFSKGGTLWCRNRQKNFFPFFKNFKNKTQKWLSWDHSNINRNKVMNFGGRSSYPAETARPFKVIRAIMAPPRPE